MAGGGGMYPSGSLPETITATLNASANARSPGVPFGKDGAAVVAVDHGDVEPATLFEQLQIAILVGGHVRQADQIKGGRDLDRWSGERHAAGLLALLHQDAGGSRDRRVLTSAPWSSGLSRSGLGIVVMT